MTLVNIVPRGSIQYSAVELGNIMNAIFPLGCKLQFHVYQVHNIPPKCTDYTDWLH